MYDCIFQNVFFLSSKTCFENSVKFAELLNMRELYSNAFKCVLCKSVVIESVTGGALF